MIPVYIVSGLLDSGKTSFIQSTLLEQDWIAKGTTLLILCEEGEYELPESYKKSKRIAEIPVSSPDSFTESYCSELTNMACLTEEVGELARVIARKYGDQSFKAGEEANLGEEMADVLWVLLCLANQTGVDLTKELRLSIEKKTRRDAFRHIENPKLKA